MENNTVELARRDDLSKTTVSQDNLSITLLNLLDQIQKNLFIKASSFLKKNTSFASSIEEMNKILNSKGGFVEAYLNGDSKTEQKIKELTKATIRCIPLTKYINGKCILMEFNSKKLFLQELTKF